MKIRIKGNTTRLRLTRPEVAAFCNDGSYGKTINFCNSILFYSLQVNDIEHMGADYMGYTITDLTPLLPSKV